MNDKNLHIDNNLSNKNFEDFFSKAEIDYNKSKEEVWEQLAMDIDKKPIVKRKISRPHFISMAAVFIALFSIYAFIKYYTISIKSAKGQHLVYNLPDNSKVSLNAESSIKYHPYWWRFSRQIDFEGEAFFEVEKGSEFTVKSKAGKTIVLGTSFNIYSRKGIYNVACMSGKVKVVSPEKFETILTPSYSAEIQSNGQIHVSKFSEQTKASEWIDNMFSFTSVPLVQVLDEVERQFNIEIEANISNDLIYTGRFSANKNINEILELLCMPFGLEYEKLTEKKFSVCP